jgi:nitrate/TMAO reductase-like tetraheme cytochrome c subunit
MASLLVDFWQLLKRYGKRLIRPIIVAAVLFLIVAAVFVRFSESPRFCYSCHIMRPYYKAWEESSHNEVNCLECHYPPTVGGHIKSKFVAISQVVQYFTGSYGTRFWAEIDDEACLQMGCHDTRLLAGEVTYKENISFDHAFHLGDMRRGKRLRCTSCHSQMVIGNHIEVTESVCYTCHFKEATLGKGTADCLTCHGPPEEPVVYKGVTFDHEEYLRREVPCVQCHIHTVRGDGAVPEARCYSCHADRSQMKTGDPVRLHRDHVTNHKVECFECHLEIRHGKLEVSSLLAPNCAGCHGNLHSLQEGMYLGTGGLDTPSVPSAMFGADVSCVACHTGAEHGLPTGAFPRATSESCVACHGVVYKRVFERWQTETRKTYERARALVNAAKAAVYATGSRDPSRASARTLIAQAEKNLDLVAADGSYGAHNIIYANALLETAALKADKAAKKVGRGLFFEPDRFKVPAAEDTCAWRCHFGVERRPLTVGGKTFDHGTHMSGGKNKCTSCHDAERHGFTLPTAYNCAACHHVKGEAECSSCHGDVSGLAVSYKGRPFDHGTHGARPGTTCRTCHPAESPSVIRADCSSCHHKEEEKNCASCHATQAKMVVGFGAARGKGKPSPMAKLGCEACHGQPPVRPGAASCTKCHPAGYANIFKVWGKTSQENYRKLSIKVKEAGGRRAALEGVTVDGRSGAAIYEEAAADLGWAGADGSWGAHNYGYVNDVLRKDAEALEQALAEIPD